MNEGLELEARATGAKDRSHRARLESSTRRAASIVIALACAITITGCPRGRAPFVPGDGGGGGPDADGDGLCDASERERGLRVDDPDTDADGYSDFVEVSLGFDPFSPLSPDTTRIIFLREANEATARAIVDVAVNGEGETYSGSFTPALQAFPDELDADAYFAGAGPVGAEPMANVFAVDDPGQAFVGVLGETLLTYEVRFRFEGETRGCMRAMPFQYSVKHEDGRIVNATRFTLVVVPPGDQPGDGEWCAPSACF